MTKNKIISIQSRLIYGYVGSNIAEFAIQLQGLDTIAFPTVLLSAHSGHKPVYGKAIPRELFEELILGIKAINVISSAFCVISGYMRTEDIIEVSHNFIKDIQKEFPDKPYICDPVMGDREIGLFIPEAIAEQIVEKLIPLCNILTPNHYELEYILKQKINSMEELIYLVRHAPQLKGKTVIVTSCILEDSKEGFIDTILINEEIAERIESPKIDIDTVGTGDLFAATLSAQLAKGLGIKDAVQNATQYISKVLNYMHSHGYEEMNVECLLAAKL